MRQQVIVKLKKAATKSEGQIRAASTVPSVLEQVIERHPDVQVQPLFPDDTDPEMATLYVITLPESKAEPLLAELNNERAVEYAHIPSERKPMKKN